MKPEDLTLEQRVRLCELALSALQAKTSFYIGLCQNVVLHERPIPHPHWDLEYWRMYGGPSPDREA